MHDGKIAKDDRVRYPRGWGVVTDTNGHDLYVVWDSGAPSWVAAKAALEVVPKGGKA